MIYNFDFDKSYRWSSNNDLFIINENIETII